MARAVLARGEGRGTSGESDKRHARTCSGCREAAVRLSELTAVVLSVVLSVVLVLSVVTAVGAVLSVVTAVAMGAVLSLVLR